MGWDIDKALQSKVGLVSRAKNSVRLRGNRPTPIRRKLGSALEVQHICLLWRVVRLSAILGSRTILRAMESYRKTLKSVAELHTSVAKNITRAKLLHDQSVAF